MKAIAGKLKTLNWYDYLLIPLFFLYFYPGIFSLWFIYTSKEFYENGVAFILVMTIFVFTILKNRESIKISSSNGSFPFISLIMVLMLNTLNSLYFRFSIVPPILFLLGSYCLLGFYLEYHFWKRSLFVFLILILTLPLLERVQKFIGFPIRLLTANIVSFILQFFGIGNISKSAVIITENHATSIDLPCSGVKSIYTGTLFMLAVYYLQKVHLSLKLFAITLVFFATLLFFNTWRVFSLVYIYDVLDMKSFGNTVHIFLGIAGFLLSCTFLWLATNRLVSTSLSYHRTELNTSVIRNYSKPIILIIFSILIAVNWLFVKQQSISTVQTIQKEQSFELKDIDLSELQFTDREKSYFVNSEIGFSNKFSGKTTNNIPFSLLIVSSKSARTHHDPEICLQGLGYEINNTEILQVNSFRLRRLTLNDNKDQVLYWYVGRDKNLLDYSERVWEEVTNPKQIWVLVIIGFTKTVDVAKPDIYDLIQQINITSKKLLETS